MTQGSAAQAPGPRPGEAGAAPQAHERRHRRLLGKWDIEAKSPDDFVLDQINIADRIVYACAQEIANSRRREPKTVADVLTELENSGLVASVAALRT
jgi:hypothetical protein